MKLVPALCLLSFACIAADVPSRPVAEKGEPLLADDFERSDLGEWKSVIPTFTVEGGSLKAVQTRDDHGAVGRVHRPIDRKSVV